MKKKKQELANAYEAIKEYQRVQRMTRKQREQYQQNLDDELYSSMVTVPFWNAQLYFLMMSDMRLWISKNIILKSEGYKPNKFTKKIQSIKYDYTTLPDKDRECIATHLALQLVGIEDGI